VVDRSPALASFLTCGPRSCRAPGGGLRFFPFCRPGPRARRERAFPARRRSGWCALACRSALPVVALHRLGSSRPCFSGLRRIVVDCVVVERDARLCGGPMCGAAASCFFSCTTAILQARSRTIPIAFRPLIQFLTARRTTVFSPQGRSFFPSAARCKTVRLLVAAVDRRVCFTSSPSFPRTLPPLTSHSPRIFSSFFSRPPKTSLPSTPLSSSRSFPSPSYLT